jgi:fluoroquinolone transport system permease protein
MTVAAGVLPRVGGLLRTEIRLLARMWVLASVANVTVAWSIAVQLVPPEARAVVVPLILLMDLAALGFYFIPSLMVLERAEGVTSAMRVTPARAGERLAVRAGALSVASLLAGIVLLLASSHGPMPTVLLGVAATSVTFALVAVVMVGPLDTLTAYMVRVPLVAVPLMLPALVSHLGLWDGWLLQASPVTGELQLMSGTFSWPQLAWQAAWIAALWLLASRAMTAPLRPARIAPRARSAGNAALRSGFSTWRAIRSFAMTDRATLLRDPLLLMIIGGVPALALVARLTATIGASLIQDRFGIDIGPYLPVVWGLMLVLHTPLMFGTLVGILFLEDRDARLLPVLASTRASLFTLAAYRLGALVLITMVMLPIGFAIAGVSHDGGWIGLAATVVAAGFLAPVPALAMASLAPNRAAGMAMMKIIGLPFYVPLATWWVSLPLAAAFGILPSTWSLWAMWADSAVAAIAFAAVGAAVCVAISIVLYRRLARRLA